jgi:NAD-dependent DNA ligase
MTVEALGRLCDAEELLGVAIVDESVESALATADIAAVLVPGARVCFTGTAEDDAGRIVDRDEMQDLAAQAGLVPVPSVTKTRCEVLVTAEVGSQSGKARKAREWGKPVFSAAEFFAWLGRVDSR